MKTDLYSLEGKKLRQIELPKQFSEPVRPDIIKRAALVIQSKKISPYGTNPRAGMGYSATVSKRRRKYRGTYGKGQSRTPRKIMTKRGSQLYFVGAFAPQTVGGRKSHPPKSEKIWEIDINKKERKKAIRSALAATLDKELVKARGHKISNIPHVIESKVEKINKTNETKKILISLGLKEELLRTQEKKVRSGKGKCRGRKYKTKIGPLIVVSKECQLEKAASNIPGVEVCQVNNLNALILAPGTIAGRLTIFTEDSINKIKENNLFIENIKDDKKGKVR